MSLANDLLAPNGLDYAQRRVRANATAQPQEFIAVNTSIGAFSVTLRAGVDSGTCIAVGDDAGQAVANPITIVPGAGTIDGAGSYVLSTANGREQFIWDGTMWRRTMKVRRIAGQNGREVPVTQLQDLTSGSSAPPGADTQVIFNDAGAFGADADFVFDKATGAFLVGDGNVAGGGAFPWVIGNANTANGVRSTIHGFDNNVSQTFGVASGSFHTVSGAGAACLGELCTAGPGANAICTGYSSTASGTYAQAHGVNCIASADYSRAEGVGATANIPGSRVHSSGLSNVQGANEVDLSGQTSVAGNVVLAPVLGGALNMETLSYNSMTIRVSGVTVGDSGAKRATEVHELSVIQGPGGVLVVDADALIAQSSGGNPAVGFAQYGWTVTIAAVGANELRITCNSNADAAVRFAARVSWQRIGNINTV